AARYACRFLQCDPTDLVRVRHDGSDTPNAAGTGDVPAERVEDIVHTLFDVQHGERARAEEELEAHLKPVVLAVPHASRCLCLEDGGVHPPAPLIPRSRVGWESRAKSEPALRHTARLALYHFSLRGDLTRANAERHRPRAPSRQPVRLCRFAGPPA